MSAWHRCWLAAGLILTQTALLDSHWHSRNAVALEMGLGVACLVIFGLTGQRSSTPGAHHPLPGGVVRKSLTPNNPPLLIGTPTQWGKVCAVLLTGGERYYHLIDADGVVSMMPAHVVEPTPTGPAEGQ